MSKVCASGGDMPSLQERLLGMDVGDGKDEDQPNPSSWKHNRASEVVARGDTVDNGLRIHSAESAPHGTRKAESGG